MSVFRTHRTTHPVPESPSLLFRDLRKSPEIKFLWGHQERLLEEYHQKHLGTSNVAFELPTGSGKTLVGLLIAEFRKRVNRERVVYLCPTRQLCNQVKAHADLYGIKCSLLVGPQRDYDIGFFTAYQRAESIAITTYSGLFNTNPKINDPQVIICDDAHGGDNYISSLWTLNINSRKMPDFYQGLIDLLGEAISDDIRRRIQSQDKNPWGRSWVDLIPAPKFADRIAGVCDFLEEHCRNTNLAYPWQMIRGHMEACNVYLAPEEILIRPIIPPTITHYPFAGATQRIFMSATLGEGGDLERIIGLPNISRLPIPAGWEKRGTGRRLILFPDLCSDAGGIKAIEDLIRAPGRTLVLATENRLVDAFSAEFKNDVNILRAADIEQDLTPFTSSQQPTALVLANRYDGLDLPGEACRSMIFLGLPAFSDLQEKFLVQRLGAHSQLRDRIRTRIAQGAGRCTRDENDYALVWLVGNDILKWCSTESNIQGMHPELQAEIKFGLDNSIARTWNDLQELSYAFFDQGEEWATANEEIVNLRDECKKVRDSVTDALEKSISHEIDYIYAFWNRDFESAYEQASKTTEALSGGSELKPYRAFWHYLSCVAADYSFRQSGKNQWIRNFEDHVNRALKVTMGVNWLADLRSIHEPKSQVITPVPSTNIEIVLNLLEDWQIVGTRFEKRLNEARVNIMANTAKQFQTGSDLLGQMLGCHTRTWDESGAPDCLWVFINNTAIVFEAKSDKDAANPISLEEVRQSATHEAWIQSKEEIPQETKCYTALITPCSAIREDAKICAEDIRHISVQKIRDLFNKTARLLNSIRAKARNLPEESLRELIDKDYLKVGLAHSDLTSSLLSDKLSSFPTG